MRLLDGKVYRDMTPAEEAEAAAESVKAATLEKQRPLTEAEVSRMLLMAQVDTIPVDDTTALRMREFYPEWAVDITYAIGFRVQFRGHLYKAIQAHTGQAGWEPTKTPALWTEITETHTGTLDDAIPYNGNMALEKGKYYIQYNEFYLCTENTINPVYHDLSQLVGLYVERC